MVFVMELGDERCRSENGKVRNGTSYQFVVYAGRDGRGRDEYARRTLTGGSPRSDKVCDRGVIAA
jgi:hypothetical protein